MKNELTNENYDALSKYGQERAHETLAEIPFLYEKGFYNTATNRLYYACYYAAVALLPQYHISTCTHAGVKLCLDCILFQKDLLQKRVEGHSQTYMIAGNEETMKNLYIQLAKR